MKVSKLQPINRSPRDPCNQHNGWSWDRTRRRRGEDAGTERYIQAVAQNASGSESLPGSSEECPVPCRGTTGISCSLLGVIMALISFTMDFTVSKMLNAHRWLQQELGENVLLQYLSWIVVPRCPGRILHRLCPEHHSSLRGVRDS
ncbi:chloride channel protein 2-like [Mixophyes fleayi]|uniref:chloride channel protein 2-like n=1 Tax=Mixophyes fleayi TaxID=3061075 RepID=UPI003F4DF93E